MAAENSFKIKLKTHTRTRKNTFTLVTLQSFSISGVISAEKMYVENLKKFTEVCMTGVGYNAPSHTNVCKLFNFRRGANIFFHWRLR